MNRYSDYSVSSYSPMTFEEIAIVPMMKRKQHDDVLAKQELIRSGLAKVDPLKEHLEEALRLKQGIESQMDNTALELSKNGINNDMIGKTIALNRQYQDLVSPTGRIGQINAAKIAEAQTKKEFMDSPELKEYGLDAKQKAWEKHRALYTGYDTPEKTNITNISDLSGPKYQDMQKDFTDLASKLGEITETNLKNIGARFQEGPFGGLIMVSGDGKTINTNNDPNLKALTETMSAKYISSKGEGYKSREFAGFDKQNTIDQLNGMMGIPRVDKTVKDMNYNYNFINDPNAEKEESVGNPSVITEDVKQQDKTRQDLDGFKNFAEGNLIKTPTPPKNLSHMTKDQQQAYYNSVKEAKRKYLVTNPNDPVEMKKRFDENFSAEQKVKYLNSYNALVAQGKIKKDANPYVKSSSDLIKKDWMRRASVEFSNQIIDVDSMDNDVLASPSLVQKTSEQRNGFIQKRLANAIGNKQDIVFDPETGRKIDMSEVKLTDVNLIGHYSPLNKLAKIGESEDNSVSPYKISWVDSEGKIKTGLMTRDASEIGKPEFRGAKLIKKTTDAAVDNEGNYTSFNIYNTPELNNIDTSVFGESVKDLGKISGMRVKYDFKTNSYNIELVNSKNKSKKLNNVDPQTYQNIIYDMTN